MPTAGRAGSAARASSGGALGSIASASARERSTTHPASVSPLTSGSSKGPIGKRLPRESAPTRAAIQPTPPRSTGSEVERDEARARHGSLLRLRLSGRSRIGRAAEFVPADFEVPPGFETSEFVLEPLGPEHNAQDYDAWTSSMDHIAETPGYPDGSWPRE